MLRRFAENWVYGGTLAGVLLLFLAPLLLESCSATLMLTFLHLPAYMIHQWEEHDDGRFRQFLKTNIGKGIDVLSAEAIFVINVPGVWGVIAISLYMAARIHIGYALIAVYLVLVNATAHVIPTLILRRYNPGLVTAILLFFPLGGYTLWQVQLAGGGTALHHSIGLLSSIGIHAAILLHVALNRRRMIQSN